MMLHIMKSFTNLLIQNMSLDSYPYFVSKKVLYYLDTLFVVIPKVIPNEKI